MTVSGASTQRDPHRPWRVVFLVSIGLSALGFLAAIAALVTDNWVLDADPCAKASDHPLVWVATVLLGGAWMTALALLVRGAYRTHAPTLVAAAITIGSLLMVSPLSLILMTAGYGWRCPL